MKVLVVVFDNLGDTVMATALLGPLRRYLPDAAVGFWVKSYAAEALAGQKVDFVHAADPFWDGSPGRGKGSFRDFVRVLGEVRAQGYDLALVLNTDWRRALACRLTGIPRRVGYAARKSRLFLTQALPPPPAGHQIDDHRRLLEAALGRAVPEELCRPRLDPLPEDRRLGQEWLSRQGWSEPELIMFQPLTGDPLKCWPLERWAELMESVGARHPRARFAIACAPDEEPLLRGLLEPLRGRAAAVVPLAEVRGLLAQTRAFVGGDSGIGHLAAAAGVPVLSLISITTPGRTGARGPGPVKSICQNPLAGLGLEPVARELGRLLIC